MKKPPQRLLNKVGIYMSPCHGEEWQPISALDLGYITALKLSYHGRDDS